MFLRMEQQMLNGSFTYNFFGGCEMRLCRWKKRRFATEEEGVLYHNEAAARTEMDSGDYEVLVSGCHNRLLT